MSSRAPLDIAVVGMGGIFPGAPDLTRFFENVLAGADLVTEIPETHFKLSDYFDPDPKAPDKIYTTRGAFLPPIVFDPLKNGIPPSMLSSTDSSQLLGLLVARATLEDAYDGRFEAADKSRISVILGVTGGQELFGQMAARLQRPAWEAGMRAAGIDEAQVQEACAKISGSFVPWTESSFPGLLGNVVAGRIANRLDTGGTNAITDAACASSFAALSMGVDELLLGKADLVLSGGVDTLNDVFMHMCFSKTPALSPSGRCRPFDVSADGTLLGEGLGMFALRRLSDAERDGNKIYAVIKGIGTSSDGRAKSVYAPVPEGQAKALGRAYELAGYSPHTVELVEAHGTGTRAGDAAELEGLGLAFRSAGSRERPWCAVGSVKSQIGHTKAAAGAAGLLKAALALHHKIIPPTIGVSEPSPVFAEPGSPFFPSIEARPWVRSAEHPRRASVSSFGFGGSNFHVALEEYQGRGRRPPQLLPKSQEIFALGAADTAGLIQALSQLSATLEQGEGLDRVARRLAEQQVFSAPHRVSFVAGSVEEAQRLVLAARSALERAAPPPPGVFLGSGPRSGKLAFVFPGQGSQAIGMGGALAMEQPSARALLDRADDVALGDRPLSAAIFPPPAFDETTKDRDLALLTRTEWAQPAIGAVSLATLAALETLGLRPELVGGHSFGELTALAAAGALDVPTLLRAARRRGELMAEAAHAPGAMIAVSASAEAMSALLGETGVAEVVIANHNAPDQVVLSGAQDAVVVIERELARRKLSWRRLPVSTAFHSPLVAAAVAPFASYLAKVELRRPRIPVYSGATGSPHGGEPAAIAQSLAEQIAQPVRFVEQIRAMAEAGATIFVEVGPGAVLTGLVGRILRDRPEIAVIATDARDLPGARAFYLAVARLIALGAPVDLAPLFADRADRPPVPVQGPGTTLIRGSNFGKPPLPEARPAPPPPQRNVNMTDERPTPPRRPAPTEAAKTEWLDVLREGQRQAAEAHLAFQKTMADAHVAFLEAMDSSSQALARAISGESPAPARAPRAEVLTNGAVSNGLHAPASAKVVAPRPAPATAPRAALVSPAPTRPAPAPAPAPVPPPPAIAPPAPVRPAVPISAAPSPVAPVDLFMAIVAEKTGYPVASLDAGLSLEADLGIDSIKRVEILGAFKERAASPVDVDPLRLAKLKTLGEIAQALGGGAAVAPRPAAPSPGPRFGEVFLAIVAEKTGYPREALQASMSLEADLGIDSIKRVEILGAFKERANGSSPIDPLRLAKLKTLGDIARVLDGEAPSTTADPPAPRAPSATADPAPRAPSTTAAPPAPRVAPSVSVLPREAVVIAAAPEQSGRPFQPSPDCPIHVIGDARGVGAELVSQLRALGYRAEVAGSAAPTGPLAGLVDLSGLDAPRDLRSAQATLSQALLSAKIVAAAEDAIGAGPFYAVIYDAGGDFGTSAAGLAQAALAGLSGLAKTAALEWPGLAVKAIDLHAASLSPQDAAAAIVTELQRGFDLPEVGLRGSSRVSPQHLGVSPEPGGALLVHAGSVIVASAGARGVTALGLRALAKAARPSLVLLGRTRLDEPEPAECAGQTADWKIKAALVAHAKAEKRALSLPEIGAWAARILAAREVRAFVAELEALGSKVLYLTADVADPAAVARAVAQGRQSFGPITGLIHGAGVLADKRISEKSAEQIDRVLSPKIAGLSALLSATAEDPLSLVTVFSSVAGRFGNVGQSDYAVANQAITSMLRSEAARRGAGFAAKAIAWGPWEGGMVSPALAQHFRQRGVSLIAPEAGAEAFVLELAGARAQELEVVIGQGMLPPPPSPTVSRTRIDVRSHAYLIDHAVAGLPVLPVALAIDLIAEQAALLKPDRVVSRIRELKVLRGVRLASFNAGGDELELRLHDRGAEILAAELRSQGGEVLHYTATVELASRREAAPKVPELPPLEPYGVSLERVYDELLFHGPSFQLIEKIQGVGPRAMAALVRGVRHAAWPDRSWQVDAAAIDAGLQLVLLWARHATRGAFLPTGVAEVSLYSGVPPSGALRAVVIAAEAPTDTRVRADLHLVDADGRVILRLSGVEAHRLPEDTAFQATRAVLSSTLA